MLDLTGFNTTTSLSNTIGFQTFLHKFEDKLV